jgi:hypothetical protein
VRFASLLLVLCACSSRPPALHDDPQALAYRSRAKVPEDASLKIAAEAVGDARRRPAWSEPNHVHSVHGYLFGEARLYLVEYETDPGKFREVDKQDDAVMAFADAAFTLEQLAEWAQKYGLEWDVQLGPLQGKVTSQGPDEGGRKLLAELSRRAKQTAAQAEASRKTLDAKYRDRR